MPARCRAVLCRVDRRSAAGTTEVALPETGVRQVRDRAPRFAGRPIATGLSSIHQARRADQPGRAGLGTGPVPHRASTGDYIVTKALDLLDIQGNVIRAYGRYSFPVARYVFLRVNDGD